MDAGTGESALTVFEEVRDAGQEGRIHGHVEHGFGAVADAFAENFDRLAEMGAAVCVHVDGRPVVDLWGGWTDHWGGTPWGRDTRVPVFSTGKGLVAMAMLRAASQGRFRLDDPVALHWPEFAVRGKETITIRQVLDHSSGIVLFGRRMRPRDFADPDRMAEALERARPQWQPGERWGYHLATFGDLAAQILTRTDPARRPFARLFEEELAQPVGGGLVFGSRPDEPASERARLQYPAPGVAAADIATAPAHLVYQAFAPFSLFQRAFGEVARVHPEDEEWLAAPFPSVNLTATARALARAYAEMAAGGAGLAISREMFDAAVAAPRVLPGGDRDAVMGVRSRWNLGFLRPGPDFAFCRSPRAFGMPGLGGSFAFADPDSGVAFAYTPNRLGVLPFDDRREAALRAAVRASIRLD